MTFNDETFGKGFIDDNGILVKLESPTYHFKNTRLAESKYLGQFKCKIYILSDFIGHRSLIK